MRLGIDLDGVVYNYVKDFQDYARRFFEYESKPDFKCDTWNFFEEWGMHTEEFIQMNEQGVKEGAIFANGSGIPDAVPTLRKLKEDGHFIHIITHRTFGPKCLENTGKWLEANDVPHDAVTFVEDKTVVSVDILLDDRDTNIIAALDNGVDAVMFDAPYNKDINLPRVLDWEHFYQYVVGRESTHKRMQEHLHQEEEQHAHHKWEDVKETRTTSSTGGQKGTKVERPDLIPTTGLYWLAVHYGLGAEKYDDNNWRKGYEWSKSYSSLQRHARAFWDGEDNDPELGTPHMAAVAFHAFALMTFMEEHPEFDDRWRPDE